MRSGLRTPGLQSRLGLLACLLLLVSCGPADDAETDDVAGAGDADQQAPEDETEDAQTSAESVGLTYSWWGGDDRNRLQGAVVDLFVEANPDVTIEVQTADFPVHWERLAVQAAADDQPDIFQMQTRYIAEFGGRGALLPLDEHVDDGSIDVSDVPEAVLEAGRFDGELLMVPTSFSYRGLYNDAEAFEAAGVESFGSDTTWDDVAAAGVALAESELTEGVWPMFNFCEDDNSFYAFLRGRGVQPYDGQALGFDREHAIAWFSYWADLREAGALPPAGLQAEALSDVPEDSMFGRAQVVIDSFPANQFETMEELVPGVTMTGLPSGPEGPGDALVVSGQSVSPSTPNAAESVAFTDFFLNDLEAAATYRADNGIPADREARDAAAEAMGGGRQFELFAEIEDNFQAIDPLPVGAPEVDASLVRACTELNFERLTVEEAVDVFFQESEAALS